MEKKTKIVLVLGVILLAAFIAQLILVNHNPRHHAPNAIVKANLSGFRAIGVLYFDLNQTYGTDTAASQNSCFVANTVFSSELGTQTIDAILNVRNIEHTSLACAVGIDGQSWAIEHELESGGLHYWCVDSAGISAKGRIVTFEDGSVSCVDSKSE